MKLNDWNLGEISHAVKVISKGGFSSFGSGLQFILERLEGMTEMAKKAMLEMEEKIHVKSN